ncbi:MAG: Cytochrome c5 [uncultured bacterium]|nr:MAG: Cytochrome c5 [uncultured bacterium]
MKRWVVIVVFFIAGISGFLISLYVQHANKLNSKKYIQSEIVLHDPLSFVSQIKNDPKAGEKIYFQYCASCHNSNPIIPVHAPSIANKKAWKKYRHWSMKKLLKKVNAGIKAMPARGGCFECSDALLIKAIKYMLAH